MVSRGGELYISPAKRKWGHQFSEDEREDGDRDMRKRRHLHKGVHSLVAEADGLSTTPKSMAITTTAYPNANVNLTTHTNTNPSAPGPLAGSVATTSERGSEIPKRSLYWEPVHPDLPILELNAKYARQKDIIRSLIAILRTLSPSSVLFFSQIFIILFITYLIPASTLISVSFLNYGWSSLAVCPYSHPSITPLRSVFYVFHSCLSCRTDKN
jgi:hypothetical protein